MATLFMATVLNGSLFAVTITDFTPTDVCTGSVQQVTINGTDFVNVISVDFNGIVVPSGSITVVSAEVRGDPEAISRYSTMGSVAGGVDDSVVLY